MKISISLGHLLGGSAAAVLIAGCSAGATQSAFGPPVAAQSVAQADPSSSLSSSVMTLGLQSKLTINARPDGQHSWMSPDTKKKKLLYVSDPSTDDVYVFSYPETKLVGTLTGFNDPYGQCSDKAGDVFITQLEALNVVEYAHGGKTPINTLTVSGYPIGCSVDPKTGNLAVATFDGVSAPGGIFVFKHAMGSPTEHNAPNMYYYEPPAYDDRGNLFVETQELSYGGVHVVELPHGRDTFKSLFLNVTINFPGGAQWDGRYVALDDQLFGTTVGSGIYRVQVKGNVGTEVSEFALPGSCGSPDVLQPWIQGSTIIAPDAVCKNVGIDKYPSGVNEEYLSGVSKPIGASVSEVKI
ncbi:MAG: hypothetical protein WAK16_06660 [Candidatus Cybelea sp.]